MPNSSRVTLAEVLNGALDAFGRQLAVSLPGTVVSYSSSARTASVRVGVHRLVPSLEEPDEDVVEKLPVLQGVPVAWPAGANFAIEGTLVPGDPVLLIAQDADISGWLRSGQPAEPDDARTHSWASAVAIPGVRATGSFPVPLTDAAALASVVDAVFTSLKTWASTPGPADPTQAVEAVVALKTALVGPPLGPLLAFTSSASSVLKVGG